VRWWHWSRLREFDARSLAVDSKTDSDGDDWFSLVATHRGRKRTLHQEMNNDRNVRRLARYLESKTGWSNFPQELPRPPS
jgi:hypothetical protein